MSDQTKHPYEGSGGGSGGPGSDTTAIHTDTANEISTVPDKAAPVGADILLIEDSDAAGIKKKVSITNLPGGADADAVHVNVSGEIKLIAEKVTAVAADIFLMEDSAVTDTKKRILFSTIEAALSLANLGTRDHASLSDAPVDAHHVKYALTDDLTAGEITQLQAIGTEAISNAEWAIVAQLVAIGSGTIISSAERTALHAKYLDSEAVDAIEAVGAGSVVAGDNILFVDLDDGVLKQDLVSNLPGGSSYTDADAVDAIEAVANAPIATGDSVIFTDVTDGVLKQDLVSDLLALGGGGPDANAVHVNEANEITGIANKASVVAADEFLMEDSDAVYVKKSVLFSVIEAALSLANLGTRDHASLSDAPVDAHHVKYLDSEAIDALEALGVTTPVAGDWMIFSDAGTLQRALLSGLTHAILTGLGGKYTDGEVQALSINNVLEDTTPQLGGGLDLNTNALTEEFVAAESLVDGDLCYMNSTGSMAKADASAEATCDTLLAMCIDTISALSTGTFVLFGRYTTTGLTTGAEYFVSETAAAITVTRPTTTAAIVRHVGSAINATTLFFNPSGVYIELA